MSIKWAEPIIKTVGAQYKKKGLIRIRIENGPRKEKVGPTQNVGPAQNVGPNHPSINVAI
jgi:hypothetical protein